MNNRDRHPSHSFLGAHSLISSSSSSIVTPDSMPARQLCPADGGGLGVLETNPWLCPETQTEVPGESDYSELLFGGTPWCGYGDDLDDDEAYFLEDEDDDDDDDIDEDYDDEDDDDFDDDDFDRESDDEDDDDDL